VLPEPPPLLPLSKSLLTPPWGLATGLTLALCLLMIGSALRARDVSSHQLCASNCPDPVEGDLSSDGRWAVQTDFDGGLAVWDQRTGRKTSLGLKRNTSENGLDAELALVPAFSRDSRQIAYLWWTGSKGQLRIIANKAGSQPRGLVDSEFSEFLPQDWTRDGKRILVLATRKDEGFELTWVSTTDGSVIPIKRVGRLPRLDRARISPDGRFIAYPAPTDPEKPAKDQHIYLVAADGSSETEIVRTAGINGNPVWPRDGSRIFFTSDRTGQTSLWSVAVANGKAAGPESLSKLQCLGMGHKR
jgi:hypothetical protein